jgi:endonuclease YncB( thermonuclease family)
MAVMVEKRFGRPALIETMLDPRRLLVLYNQVAAEQNAAGKEHLPLWSDDLLKQVRATS